MKQSIRNFFDWLDDEAKGINVAGYVVFAALVITSLQYVIRAALINWNFVPPPPLPQPGDMPFAYSNIFEFISMFVWAPIMEEVIFRVLPLTIVIAFVSKSPTFVFGAATLFAIIFGAIHPYGTTGRIEVAIAGFFFGLVFLKCGGLQKSFMKASICAMAAHGFSNVFSVLNEYWRYFELTAK